MPVRRPRKVLMALGVGFLVAGFGLRRRKLCLQRVGKLITPGTRKTASVMLVPNLRNYMLGPMDFERGA